MAPIKSIALGLVALTAMASCGERAADPVAEVVSPDDTSTSGVEPARDGWRLIDLAGALSPDTGLILGERDGAVVVVTATEDQGLSAWHVDLATSETTPTPLDPASGFIRVAGITNGIPGLVAVATIGSNDETPRTIVPWAYLSADGRSWTSAQIDRSNADVLGVAWDGDAYLAVGAQRTGADPSRGPFAPIMWRSTDGLTWEQLPAPAEVFGSSGSLRTIAVVRGEVIVTGRTGASESEARPSTWRSIEGGSIWETVATGNVEVTSIAEVDGEAVGTPISFDDGSSPALVRLTSDGWRPLPLDDGVLRAGEPNLIARSDGAIALAVGTVHGDPFRNPAACYQDPEPCNGYPGHAVLTRTPEGAWRAVAEPAGIERRAGAPDAIVTPTGQVVIALTWRRTALAVWTDGPLPTVEPEPTTSAAGPPIVEHDATLELGRTYRYPLYTHCGFPSLGFNGTTWATADTLPRPGPQKWPIAQQSIFGEVTLVAEDRIEYSIPDVGVIATYTPTDVTPPPCM